MAGEKYIGLSQRPDFLVFERRFSDWGVFDSPEPAPNFPMQPAIEGFMQHASNFPAFNEESRRLDGKFEESNSVTVAFRSRDPRNTPRMYVVEGQYGDSDRKIFYVGLPHFRQVMVFDTKRGPHMRFRRAEAVAEWISVGGIQGSGALDYPAGPAQIDQYTSILQYTRESLERGTAIIETRIAGKR